MTSPPPEGRPAALSRIMGSALLTPFLAVIGVTVVLSALFVWRQDGLDGGPLETRAGSQPTATSRSARVEPATDSPAGPPKPAAPPSSVASGSSSIAPAPSPRPTPTPSATPSGPPVVVVDQSGRAGLADRVAQGLRAAGWTVERVGTFRGSVRTTTVYYPEGQDAAAKAVAGALATKARTLPRFAALSGTSLTVVLTVDYPA